MSGKGEPWFDAQDEEIFSLIEVISGKYIPPQAEFLKHLENYANGQDFTLQWKCIGRRELTPERKETKEIENGDFLEDDNKVDQDIYEGMEFEEETDQLSLSSVRRNATPQNSSKKTRTNSLQSILYHIERHRKIDMLGTKDELENKMKQQEHLHESNSNQSNNQSSNATLNDDNSSQMSSLQNNEIEPLEDHIIHSSLDENSQLTDKSSNLTPSDSSELKQVQHEVQKLQIFQEMLPQSSLNFQNILNKKSENTVTNSQSASSSSTNSKEPIRNIINVSVSLTEQPSSTNTNTRLSPESIQTEDHNLDFDTIGMSVKPMDFIEMKESGQSIEMLGSDLPLPEGAKQDLSEFDFQMDD